MNYPAQLQGMMPQGGDVCLPRRSTIRENIDQQIAVHEEALARLREAREKLAPILDVDAGTLQSVIRW
jgi:hypothetical protein